MGVDYPFAQSEIVIAVLGFAITACLYVLSLFTIASYVPDLFPTALRLRGTGLANTIGRAVSIALPYAVAAAGMGIAGVLTLHGRHVRPGNEELFARSHFHRSRCQRAIACRRSEHQRAVTTAYSCDGNNADKSLRSSTHSFGDSLAVRMRSTSSTRGRSVVSCFLPAAVRKSA